MPRTLNEEVLVIVYNYLEDYIAVNNYPPLHREIGAAVQIDSGKTVPRYLTELQRRGLVTFKPHVVRSLQIKRPYQ